MEKRSGGSNDRSTLTTINLRCGYRTLRFYLDRENQKLNRAPAAYNGSFGSLRYPNKVRAARGNQAYSASRLVSGCPRG